MAKRRRHRRKRTLVLLSLGLATAARAEVVELVPDERAGWSPANLFAPITGFFLGGPGYWYGPRQIEVETTPPGAVLDLFYVRANFQKRYEQAESPATVVLPKRIEAGPRDSVTIRALLDGYRQREVHVRVRSRESRVAMDLEPVPNQLVMVTHTYLAGRASLNFLTKETLTFRVQKSDDAYSLILLETGQTPGAEETLDGLSSKLISSMEARQVGEDLVVRIALTNAARDGAIELRSRRSHDPVRRLHSFGLDLVPPDRGAGAVREAHAALARIHTQHVTGCSAEFEEALREQLDPAALARALGPKGAFTDPYLRAAVKRLGEVSRGGVIWLADGSKLRPAAAFELTAAVSQASEAQGYLALLRQFVAELEPPAHRRETLRGLIAPEVGSPRFAAILETAEARERSCRHRAASQGLSRRPLSARAG